MVGVISHVKTDTCEISVLCVFITNATKQWNTSGSAKIARIEAFALLRLRRGVGWQLVTDVLEHTIPIFKGKAVQEDSWVN